MTSASIKRGVAITSVEQKSKKTKSKRPLASTTVKSRGQRTFGPRLLDAVRSKGVADSLRLASKGVVVHSSSPPGGPSLSDDDCVEVKESVPPRHSELSGPTRMVLRSLLGEQILQLSTTTEFKVSTTAGGAINTTFNVSGITGSTEWGSINQLFDEFFVLSMTVKYFPLSVYQYITTSPPTTNFTNVPFASVSLFHNNTAYAASLAGPAENSTCRFGNTMAKHTHVWRNNENWRSGVSVNSSSSATTATQGWCMIAATPASNYAGFVQFTGSDLLAASSFQYGRAVVYYKALYRNRS